jgi:hypothetical protein
MFYWSFWWNCRLQNGIISTTFIKAGAHVQVIMTPASKDFVTPTLSTLSKTLL